MARRVARRYNETRISGAFVAGRSRDHLDSLTGLFDALVQLGEQRRRATRIEEDRAEFEALVSGWIQTYAPDLLGRAPDLAAEELVRRFQAAEHRRAEDARIRADLTELGRALSVLEARAEHAEAELESLRLEAGAAELAALPAIEARVLEARGLRRELDAVEASLLKDAGVPLEALLAAARGIDRATLQVRLRELEEEVGLKADIVGFNDHVESIVRDGRGVQAHYVIASFVALWTAGEARLSEETDATIWVDPRRLGDLATTPGLECVLARAAGMIEARR